MEESNKPDQGLPSGQLGLQFNIPFYNNTLPMMIWDFKTLDIIEVNEKAVEVYGYSREEFLQMNIRRIRPVEDIPLIEEITRDEKNYGAIHKRVWRHTRKSGEIMLMEISGYVVTHDGRKVVINHNYDVTEKIKAENDLKESEKRYKLLFSKSPIPMFIYEKKTYKILEMNEMAIDQYGYSRDEFFKMTILDFRPIEEAEATVESVTEKEKYHQLGIYNHLKKNQSSIKVEVSGYEITYQDKDCMLIVCNDVTEKEENLQKIKENEQKLFNGKQQLSLIYNNVRDIVFLIDVEENKKFKFASVNRSFTNSTGLSENDTIGKYVTDIIPEPSLSIVIGKYNEAIKRKTKITWEETTEYPTGTKVGIVTINPVFDSEGDCTQLIGSVQDITERKKEERQLKLLESVITNATDSVMITEAEPFDEPGPRILYVNNAFTKMTGYTAEEVIGKTPRILQGPKSDKAELKRLSAAIRKWEFCEITTINYKKDGQEFWMNFSVTPVANETGWFTHWIAIERDVTEKIKAEQKLKALYNERNAILESIGDAFFAVDSNWIVTYWNNMAEKVLKKPKDKILDKNLWEVFSESIGSESYKKYHEALETKQAIRFEDYYPPLKKWYEICAYPSDGGLSVYVKDITDNKSYTNAIQEQNKKLREISWIQSHLVRAPLARIMALAPLIAELKQSDAEREEMLRFLTLSANELDAVIKDIIEKSNILDS